MNDTKEWHRICAFTDIHDGGKIGRQFQGTPILIIKLGQDVFCYEDRCPHAGPPLVDGGLSSGRLTCRHHQWQFDVRTGQSIRPLGRELKSYAIKVESGDIFVTNI